MLADIIRLNVKIDTQSYKTKRGDKKGPAVDDNLAALVNGLFREGHSEEVSKDIRKLYDTPENCAHLTPVKVNQLVWDILAPGPQATDVKLQMQLFKVVDAPKTPTLLGNKDTAKINLI